MKDSFRRLSKWFHPDKNDGSVASTERTQQLNEARDALLDEANRNRVASADFYFLKGVKDVPSMLQRTLRDHLENDAYDRAVVIFQSFNCPEFDDVADVVRPPLDVTAVRAETLRTIQSHIDGLSIRIDNAWKKRDFEECQRVFRALDSVEASFRYFPTVCSKALSPEITRNVEAEIDALAAHLKNFLASECTEIRAFEQLEDFALRLIRLDQCSIKSYIYGVLY